MEDVRTVLGVAHAVPLCYTWCGGPSAGTAVRDKVDAARGFMRGPGGFEVRPALMKGSRDVLMTSVTSMELAALS